MYIDLVVILNFLVDFLLLVGTNRLAGYSPEWGKAALAALLGGVYGGICVLNDFRFLGSTLWRIVFLGGMSVIAFGLKRGALRRCVLFILLSMALGGIALGLGSGSFGTLIGAALGVCVLCIVGFRGKTEAARYVPVEISHGDKHLRITALYDTGNTLRDPVSGERVLVAGADIARELLGLEEAQLRKPIEVMVKTPVPGLRLIPYCAVGQPGAMLLAIRCNEVKIDKWKGSALVAFAPEVLGKGDIYQALTGGVV
ncbi:MAG: sigma-E processing peptidase SpoIIGA [Oscillospiraceae bacterium]|nr:sigma-E processing peptidase SpoIIGA [Oscillospiraceae bacterium]